MRNATAFSIVLFSCLTIPTAASAELGVVVTFDASANALTADERAVVESHVREAGRQWYRVLGIGADRSIEVIVAMNDMATASAASTVSARIDDDAGGRETLQQGIGAELRTGVDPNGAEPDGTITLGAGFLRNQLWFDPDPSMRTAPMPANRIDAMTVLLHEWGHMIAYNGWADVNTGQPPAGYWSVFDRWMQPGRPTVFTGPQSVLTWGTAPDLTTGNVMHWGNPASFDVTRPPARRATAPVQWRDGLPLPLPVDEPTTATGADAHAGAAGSLTGELMNGVAAHVGYRAYVSVLDRAVLHDVGLLVDGIFADDF